jgi:hypothetical protein
MSRESVTIALRIEHIRARTQERSNAIEVVEQLELARRVIPAAAVVRGAPRAQRRERLDLDIVLPPLRAQREAISLPQASRV